MATFLVFASPDEMATISLPTTIGTPTVVRMRNGSVPSDGTEQADEVYITIGALQSGEIAAAYEGKANVTPGCDPATLASTIQTAAHAAVTASVTPPTVSALEPATAVLGSADVEMVVVGTGFTDETVIVFNGLDEPTTFVDDTHVSTGVKPSIFTVAEALPVHVRNPSSGDSNSMDFTFTEAGAGALGREGRPGLGINPKLQPKPTPTPLPAR